MLNILGNQLLIINTHRSKEVITPTFKCRSQKYFSLIFPLNGAKGISTNFYHFCHIYHFRSLYNFLSVLLTTSFCSFIPYYILKSEPNIPEIRILFIFYGFQFLFRWRSEGWAVVPKNLEGYRTGFLNFLKKYVKQTYARYVSAV